MGQDALQEVLLILEECWNNSPELQNVPIYQASGLARRAISVYQTYIEMMNDDIKAAFQVCKSRAFPIKLLAVPRAFDSKVWSFGISSTVWQGVFCLRHAAGLSMLMYAATSAAICTCFVEAMLLVVDCHSSVACIIRLLACCA